MNEQALRARRAAEQMAEDASARINELTTVNVNLTSIRVKLEQELSVYAADFEEASKELKVSPRWVELRLMYFRTTIIKLIYYDDSWLMIVPSELKLNLSTLWMFSTRNRNALSKSNPLKRLWRSKSRT